MNVIIPSVSLAADSSPCNRGSLCKNISRLFLPRRVGGVDAHQDHRHAHDLPQAEGLLQQHHARQYADHRGDVAEQRRFRHRQVGVGEVQQEVRHHRGHDAQIDHRAPERAALDGGQERLRHVARSLDQCGRDEEHHAHGEHHIRHLKGGEFRRRPVAEGVIRRVAAHRHQQQHQTQRRDVGLAAHVDQRHAADTQHRADHLPPRDPLVQD